MTPIEGAVLKEASGLAVKGLGKLSTELVERISLGGRKEIIQWNRYALIYAPLRMLMNEMHIAKYKSNDKIPLIKRWKRAKSELLKFRLISFVYKFKEAEYDYEIEIGGRRSFPIKEIKTILDNNPEWTDTKLLHLFHWVVKADVEDSFTNNYGRDFLTEEENQFRHYVLELYDELNKKFIG